MPAVAVPSRNNAAVSLMLRPQRCWIAMNKAVPSGRAMNAKEKIVKESSSPSSCLTNGKNTLGKISTEAMP